MLLSECPGGHISGTPYCGTDGSIEVHMYQVHIKALPLLPPLWWFSGASQPHAQSRKGPSYTLSWTKEIEVKAVVHGAEISLGHQLRRLRLCLRFPLRRALTTSTHLKIQVKVTSAKPMYKRKNFQLRPASLPRSHTSDRFLSEYKALGPYPWIFGPLRSPGCHSGYCAGLFLTEVRATRRIARTKKWL